MIDVYLNIYKIQMMRKAIYLCFFISFNIGFSQGLNNKYRIDEKDLKEVLSALCIDIYKFPIKTNKKKYINFITYQYVDGKLVDSTNYYSLFEESIKLYGNDFIPSITKDDFFRIYFKKSDNNLSINFSLNDFSQKMNFNFENIKLYGSRAFDINTRNLLKRTRIMAYYGIKDETKELHCAGNATNEELIKRMDNLIIIYIEPLNI